MTGTLPRDRRALAVLAILTVAAYAGSLFGPFQFDDHAVIATDAAVREWAAWWETLDRRIRPVFKASIVATHHLGARLGHPTLGHHLGSLAVHLAAVLLAWRLARDLATGYRLPRDEAGRAALVCAAVFALHPLATEAVAYLSGRSVALATVFLLAAALAQLRAGEAGLARGARLAWRVGAMAAVAAALLSRETMIAAPALLALLEWGRGDAPGEPFGAPRLGLALRRTAGSWLVAFAAIAAILAHRRYAPLVEMSALIARDRLAEPSLLAALEHFASRLLLLAPPDIDPSPRHGEIGVAHRAAASLVIAAAFALAWRFRRSHPWWLLGGAWLVVALLPSYLVPIRHDGVSERHLYPAIWAAGFALSTALASRPRGPASWAATGAILAVLAIATASRSADYASESALWESAARVPGAGPRAFNNLGVAYMGERRWDDASRAFERALALDPGYALARANLERSTLGRRGGDPFGEPEI